VKSEIHHRYAGRSVIGGKRPGPGPHRCLSASCRQPAGLLRAASMPPPCRLQAVSEPPPGRLKAVSGRSPGGLRGASVGALDGRWGELGFPLCHISLLFLSCFLVRCKTNDCVVFQLYIQLGNRRKVGAKQQTWTAASIERQSSRRMTEFLIICLIGRNSSL